MESYPFSPVEEMEYKILATDGEKNSFEIEFPWGNS